MIKKKEDESKSGDISKATVTRLSFSLRVVKVLLRAKDQMYYCDVTQGNSVPHYLHCKTLRWAVGIFLCISTSLYTRERLCLFRLMMIETSCE